jgi:hypothetical protein
MTQEKHHKKCWKDAVAHKTSMKQTNTREEMEGRKQIIIGRINGTRKKDEYSQEEFYMLWMYF